MTDARNRALRAKGIDRRAVLAGGAAAAGALAAPAVVRAQAGQIVFATWGGSWEQAMRRAWFDPFTQRTGIRVVTVSGNAYGRIQAMVEAGRPEWDVVEVLADFQFVGAERNLLERIDYSVVDRSVVMPGRNLTSDFSVPQVLFSRLVAYNNRRYREAPTSWSAILDLQRFAGMRTFQNRPQGGMLEAALLADGVAPSALYPLDVDRALARLRAIRPNILFHDTNAQAEQYLTDGQALMGLVPDGRALNAKTNGAPIDLQYELSLLTWSSMVIPRGAPNRDAAMRFIAYALTPEAQAAIAMAFTYGPVVPRAFDMIPAERARILSGGPQTAGRGVLMDEAWWGANLRAVTEKVNAWMLT